MLTYIVVGILLLADVILTVMLIRTRRQRDEAADAIRETALECYDVGWNDALDHVEAIRKRHKEIRAAQ